MSDIEIGNTAIQRLLSLGGEMVQLTNTVDALERELNMRKKQLDDLSSSILPQAMHDIGMAEFRLVTGERIKIKPILTVTLPKPNVNRAEKWLVENGHEGIMKHSLEVTIPRTTQHEELRAIKSKLDSLGVQYDDKKTIHYQTLNRWARECDENGEVIPIEIFNVHRTIKTVVDVE